MGAVAAVNRLHTLSRETVRGQFDKRFTARRMAEDYLAIYRSLAGEQRSVLRAIRWTLNLPGVINAGQDLSKVPAATHPSRPHWASSPANPRGCSTGPRRRSHGGAPRVEPARGAARPPLRL